MAGPLKSVETPWRVKPELQLRLVAWIGRLLHIITRVWCRHQLPIEQLPFIISTSSIQLGLHRTWWRGRGGSSSLSIKICFDWLIGATDHLIADPIRQQLHCLLRRSLWFFFFSPYLNPCELASISDFPCFAIWLPEIFSTTPSALRSQNSWFSICLLDLLHVICSRLRHMF